MLLAGITYLPHEHNEPQKELKENIPWSNYCGGLIEYQVLNESSLPMDDWRELNCTSLRVEKDSIFLKMDEVSSLKLSGCSLLNDKLYPKFTCLKGKRAISTSPPWGEETKAYMPVLGRAVVLQIVPKVKADEVIIYLHGDINCSIKIPRR